MSFTHLHVHTGYSLLDGSCKIKEIIRRAKELNMTSLAITDHGVMYGVIDFYKEAKANGIKPILGCEVYVSPASRFEKQAKQGDRYYHLILLAKNNKGYENLTKIVSKGFTEGFYYKPRIDFELLEKYHEGIIALSACLAGEIPKLISRGREDEARKAAKKYKDLFGEDSFYLELQNHGIPEQKFVNQVLVKIGNVLQRVDASELTSVLKGYTAGLIDKVEVVTQPPLRYDPDGDAAMIILHTSSVFKEYIGGTIGTEEMIGGKDNFRYGGYGSLLYNHSGLFVSIAPSINFNGSKSLEQQEYETNTRLYKVSTPSLGRYNYKGIRGNLQYEYNNNGFIGLAFSWNKKKYDNLFESSEETSSVGIANRIVNNKNAYNSGEPRFTATTYWETTLGNKENKMWLELSYFNLTNNSQTDYAGHENSSHSPFLKYTENNDLKTSGLNFNNDYAIYLDAERKFLLT